ncbi:MAG TPA: hypothetical protein DEP47_12740 [Chloroflexi bacterium]|nr:hypothetical protein [Chloroflexota bacterium]
MLDILVDPDFIAGNLSTSFLQERMEPWHPSADMSNSTWLALASFEALRSNEAQNLKGKAEKTTEEVDPWCVNPRWRNVS